MRLVLACCIVKKMENIHLPVVIMKKKNEKLLFIYTIIDYLSFLPGYDSASHSPPSSSNTPPHILEDNDMSVSSVRETTPPVIQVTAIEPSSSELPKGIVTW